MSNAIAFEHLSHRYGQRAALDDVTLSVERGQIVALLGPNGSGKTTLFRILSTLVQPQQGEASVLGLDLTTQPQQIRRQIGVVFQSPSLDKQLSAYENLWHQGHLYGLRGASLHGRIESLLTRFGLWDRTSERVAGFSGGMRRRVEIAKGLLHSPRLLLLDEPSTGLDPLARLEVWRHLEQVRDSDGVTVLLTTHLMDEADRCDRVAILDRGRLVAFDRPQQLKSQIGGDVITLSAPDLPALQQALRHKLGLAAEIVDHVIRFEHPRGYEFIPALFQAVPGMIQSISVSKPTLEDVFLHTTGHRFDAGVVASATTS